MNGFDIWIQTSHKSSIDKNLMEIQHEYVSNSAQIWRVEPNLKGRVLLHVEGLPWDETLNMVIIGILLLLLDILSLHAIMCLMLLSYISIF